MDVDSDSDISLLDEDDVFRAKGKGKAKATERRKKDKGKGKAKDVSPPHPPTHHILLTLRIKARVHVGGIVHALVGYRAGGRGRQSAECRRGLDGPWSAPSVSLPSSQISPISTSNFAPM